MAFCFGAELTNNIQRMVCGTQSKIHTETLVKLLEIVIQT